MRDRPEPHDYEAGLWPGEPCARCGLEEISTVHWTPQPHRMARASDPETSKAGARSVRYRAGTQKAELLAVYAIADRPISDAQAATISGLIDKPGACWWKRCSDLRDDGMIEPVGTVTSPITDEQVMACRITDEGRRLWRMMEGDR